MTVSRCTTTSKPPDGRVESRRRRVNLILPGVVLLLLDTFGASAQSICDSKQKGTIACLLPNVVDSALHSVDPSLPGVPGPLSGDAALLGPLTSSLPLPSPASGISYTFDSSTGAYIRTPQTLGPILAERSETIGRNRIFLGFAFQRFVFDTLDGTDLHDISTIVGGGTTFPVTNHFNIGLQVNQFTTFATYGITNRLDVSLAVPITTTYLGISYNGILPGVQPIPIAASGRQTASGFGDVHLEVKGTAFRSEHAGVALGANLRLPTGNEYQGLGSGAVGIEPFVVLSATYQRVTPHINLGYQLNGKSVLADDPVLGVKSRIPSQVPYAVGADIGVSKGVTVALDILGQEAIHAPRLSPTGFDRHSFNMTNGSVGCKLNPFGNFLLVANVLFKLNDGGLRSRIVPLIGVSYAF